MFSWKATTDRAADPYALPPTPTQWWQRPVLGSPTRRPFGTFSAGREEAPPYYRWPTTGDRRRRAAAEAAERAARAYWAEMAARDGGDAWPAHGVLQGSHGARCARARHEHEREREEWRRVGGWPGWVLRKLFGVEWMRATQEEVVVGPDRRSENGTVATATITTVALAEPEPQHDAALVDRMRDLRCRARAAGRAVPRILEMAVLVLVAVLLALWVVGEVFGKGPAAGPAPFGPVYVLEKNYRSWNVSPCRPMR